MKYALVALFLVAALAGCSKKLIPPVPGPKYLPSSTPSNVLSNLRVAYTSRDSSGYDSLFANAYTGASIDNSTGTPVILNFTKADEARHISALARRASIAYIYLQFGSTLRYTDSSDPSGWATVQVMNPLLAIEDHLFILNIHTNETMMFKFAPTTPALGSPTDTTWKIIGWSEIP